MTSWLAMAMKAIILCGFILSFFRFGSATYCTIDNDCSIGETCCHDSVCREECYYCSYDYQCGTGEQCCDGGNCLSSCSTTSPWTTPISYVCTFDSDCELDYVCCDGDCLVSCPSTWTGGSIVGAVFGTIVFFSIIFSFVSCYFCAWCPYYRYRSPGTVIVSRQVPYQPFVTTTHTTMTQNMPPPPNYNQAAPPGCQPPPPYSGYPQQAAQYPPPLAPASVQHSMAPKATA